MSLDIDLGTIFVVLTFGCILFVLQTLVDYTKRASSIRPQLHEVLRVKDRHKEEMNKVQQVMDDVEKEVGKHQDAIMELETKYEELEMRATELRKKVADNDGFKW